MTTPLLTLVLEPIVRRHRLQRTLLATAVGMLGLFLIALAVRTSASGFPLSALMIVVATLKSQ